MRVEIRRSYLQTALQSAASVIQTKPVSDVSAGIHIQVSHHDLVLILCSSSLIYSYSIPACQDHLTIIEPGTIVVSARHFMTMIRNIQGNMIRLENDPQNNLHIQSLSTVYRLHVMKPNPLPDIREYSANAAASVNNHILKKMINQVSFASALQTESRTILTGILLQADPQTFSLTATDGIRYASSSTTHHTLSNPCSNSVILPAGNLKMYSKLLTDDSGFTDILFLRDSIMLSTGHFLLKSTQMQGVFPLVSQPQGSINSDYTMIILRTPDFLQSLERILWTAGNTNVIKIRFSSAGAELSSRNPEIGQASDVIPYHSDADMERMELSISFNGKLMKEIVQAIDDEQMTITFIEKDKPVVIQPLNHGDIFYLLSPIRTPL